MASNLGQATTVSEILSIDDIEKEFFKDNNMNLLYGPVNDIRYGTEMIGLPTLTQFHEEYEKKNKVT